MPLSLVQRLTPAMLLSPLTLLHAEPCCGPQQDTDMLLKLNWCSDQA